MQKFEDELSIEPLSSSESELRLRLRGVDAPFVNALRRTMLDDVPTMAVDKVVMYQNTSVLNDEVLVHRLGLIPVLANPDLFISKREDRGFNNENCIKFKLKKKCDENHNDEKLYDRPGRADRLSVYASDMELDNDFHQSSEVHEDIR